MSMGPEGKLIKKYGRRAYYVCNLDPMRSKKLKQSKLSFTRITQDYRGVKMTFLKGAALILH